MYHLALYIAKVADWVIHTLALGSGSTWPGEVALRIDPDFVSHSLVKGTTQVILVAGTNGKTTTSLLIVEGLRKAGKSVIHNSEGANLLNGVASTLIRSTPLIGSQRPEYAVFELDENALSQVASQIHSPHAVLLLNLFRDQLDRYGEVHAISDRWGKALNTLPQETNFFINGDDPRLVFIGSSLSHVSYFGAEKADKEKKEIPHDVDSVHCPKCGTKLEYSAMSYSHLGDFVCNLCHFSTPEKWTDTITPLANLSGTYNRYNIRAAVVVLGSVLHISYEEARELLGSAGPAFGRQEHVSSHGKDWILILSKNPSGFNQSISSLKELLKGQRTTICIVLNDRIPDGTDVSWIWDVEFDKVFEYATDVITTGDRTYDMAIRMKTSHPPSHFNISSHLIAEQDLNTALMLCTKQHSSSAPIVVLATYTGMLEARKLLIGRKML